MTFAEVRNAPPHRPAWIEIDLACMRRNYALLHADKPASLQVLAVVKDDAYGHGAVPVAEAALDAGVKGLAVSNLAEGAALREAGIRAPILVFGEIHPAEMAWMIHFQLTACINRLDTARALSAETERRGGRVAVHLKVETGMGRFGVHWSEAAELAEALTRLPGLYLEGIFSHFARSDEADKSFAHLQLERFQHALAECDRRGLAMECRHLCNTGGFLDLPQAHLDMVRIGILPLGVYPSRVCRRLRGLKPVMTVKSRLAAVRDLQKGDNVGYGLRYQAPTPRRIAVLPMGYGDGYPRVRNEGHVLIHGRRAPIVGANAMDTTMVDVTQIPEAGLWDEAVLMGRQGREEISVHQIAEWKKTVSYEVLAGWRHRVPRIYSPT